MRFQPKKLVLALTAAAMLGLTGCGGGSGGGSVASLSGTAAVGAPMANAAVTLKDSTGKTLTTEADANGAFTFTDLSGLTAPLMLQAKGTVGGVSYTLHSFAPTATAAGVSGVLNVTPATDAVVAQAAGANPASVFDDSSKIKLVDSAKLADAKAKLMAALADVLIALGQTPANVDLFTTAFAANGQGLDKLLDVIQFEHKSNDTTGQNILVTEKGSDTPLLISPTTVVASVPKVVAPSATALALDTSKIKDLLAAFNLAFKKATVAEQVTAIGLLVDDGLLEGGQDKNKFINDISDDNDTVELVDFVQQGCNDEKICKIDVTGKFGDGSTEKWATSVKMGTDGKWRAYGDRIPFNFELDPMVSYNYYLNPTTKVRDLSYSEIGVKVYFPTAENSRYSNTAKSVEILISADNGATWSIAGKLKSNSNCQGRDTLTIDDSTKPFSCSTTLAVGDASALAANASIANGTRRFKIKAYANADYTGAVQTYEARAKKELFTAASAAAAVAASGFNVTDSQLGTNSVAFFGAPRDLNIGVNTGNFHTGSTKWDGSDLAALNGVATVAKANAYCVKNGDTQSNCDTWYGTSAVINNINLYKRDSLGRKISVNFQ